MADVTINSFQVDNTGKIDMSKVQSWRNEINQINIDIAALSGPIGIATTVLKANEIKLKNYQNLTNWEKFKHYFTIGQGSFLATEKRYQRAVNRSQKNLDKLNAKLAVLNSKKSALELKIQNYFDKYQDKGGLKHAFRKVGYGLKVRDGVINFDTLLGRNFLNKMLTNSNPPKVNQAQYKKLMELVAKYPGSLTTIPTKYLDAMKNTDVELNSQNVNGFDAISRTAYAGMRLAERQGNQKIINSKSQLEAFDQANRTRYGMSQQGLPGTMGADLNKEQIDFT